MRRKAPDISSFLVAHAFIYQLMHPDIRFRWKICEKICLKPLLPRFLLKQEYSENGFYLNVIGMMIHAAFLIYTIGNQSHILIQMIEDFLHLNKWIITCFSKSVACIHFNQITSHNQYHFLYSWRNSVNTQIISA